MENLRLKASGMYNAFIFRKRVKKYSEQIEGYYRWFLSLSDNAEFKEYIRDWEKYSQTRTPTTKEPSLKMIDSKTRYHFCQEFEKIFKDYLLIEEIQVIKRLARDVDNEISTFRFNCEIDVREAINKVSNIIPQLSQLRTRIDAIEIYH